MSIFKGTRGNKELDDSTVVVNDFIRQKPYGSYRPVNYRINSELTELKPVLDDHLEKLFSGQIDEGNGDVLDNIIFDSAHKALTDLDAQKVQHDDIIRGFETEAVGAYSAFQGHRVMVSEELENMKDLLSDIQTRIKNNKWRTR